MKPALAASLRGYLLRWSGAVQRGREERVLHTGTRYRARSGPSASGLTGPRGGSNVTSVVCREMQR